MAYNKFVLPTGFYMTDEDFSAAKQKLIDRYKRLKGEYVLMTADATLWATHLRQLANKIDEEQGFDEGPLKAVLSEQLAASILKWQAVRNERDKVQAQLKEIGISAE